MILEQRLGDLSGLDAVVVGRSILFGKPMAQLLLAANCTVTMAHSRTRNLPDLLRRADIVVAAIGQPEFIRGDWLKPGAIVLDGGINRLAPAEGETKGRLVGDVAFDEAVGHVGAITPVPGGVGATTIAVLLRNAIVAAYQHAGLEVPQAI
jgi:methylenetetrahydrofolate dehydrogenase (NADP+)/methenyltetrahydrofolate cyclohydrolase